MKHKLAVSIAGVSIVLLSGCGSDKTSGHGRSSGGSGASLSATQLQSKAKAAVRSAKSFHLAGNIASKGSTVGLDIGLTNNGSSGSVTLERSKIELTEVGSTAYFKAGAAFWQKEGASADQAQKLGAKWVKVSTNDANYSDLAALGSKTKLVDQMSSGDSGPPTKGAAKTINGVDCVSFTTAKTTVYVDQDTLLPIEIDGSGDSTGRLTFSDYDSVPTPSAPPAADTVDIKNLGG